MANKTSPRSLQARERERLAFQLRKAGASYGKIGEQLGVSRAAAHKAVRRVLDAIAQDAHKDAARVRDLELARLDELLLGLWSRASRGEYHAVDRVLKVLERRSRYLGLDAPTQSEVVASVDTQLITTREARAGRNRGGVGASQEGEHASA